MFDIDLRSANAPAFGVANYQTFGFFRPLGADHGNVTLLESKQLMAPATREFEMAGLRRDDASPELLVNFVISTLDFTGAAVRSSPFFGQRITSAIGLSRPQRIDHVHGGDAIQRGEREHDQP